MPAGVQKREPTGIRRGQIADAARQVIIKHGSEHVTIKRIAEETGITEGAIYRHFQSKRDILSYLVNDVASNLIGDVERESASGGTPLQIIEKTLKSHISHIEQRKGVSFLVIAEIISLGDRELNSQVSSVLDRYNTLIRDIIARGVKTGEIRKDIVPDTAALLLSSNIHGLVNMWALSNCSFGLEERYLSIWQMLSQSIFKHPNPEN